jgi:hypothetical protein
MVASGHRAIAARDSGFMTAVGPEWLNEMNARFGQYVVLDARCLLRVPVAIDFSEFHLHLSN